MHEKLPVPYRVYIFGRVLGNFNPLEGVISAFFYAKGRCIIVASALAIIAADRFVFYYFRYYYAEWAGDVARFARGAAHGIPLQHTPRVFVQRLLRAGIHAGRLIAASADVFLNAERDHAGINILAEIGVIAALNGAFIFAVITLLEVNQDIFHN